MLIDNLGNEAVCKSEIHIHICCYSGSSYGICRSIHACLCEAIRVFVIHRWQHIFNIADTWPRCQTVVRCFC